MYFIINCRYSCCNTFMSSSIVKSQSHQFMLPLWACFQALVVSAILGPPSPVMVHDVSLVVDHCMFVSPRVQECLRHEGSTLSQKPGRFPYLSKNPLEEKFSSNPKKMMLYPCNLRNLPGFWDRARCLENRADFWLDMGSVALNFPIMWGNDASFPWITRSDLLSYPFGNLPRFLGR